MGFSLRRLLFIFLFSCCFLFLGHNLYAAEDFVAVAGPVHITGTTAQFEVSVLSSAPVETGVTYKFGVASTVVLPSGVSVSVKPVVDNPLKASVSVLGASAGATLFIPIQVLRSDGVVHVATGIVSIPFATQPSNGSVGATPSTPGDFLLIASPSTITVSSSRKFSFSVSVVSASSSSVKFSVPVSSGVTDVSILPQSVSAGGVVVVSGAIDSRAGGGTYPVTVVGVDGFGISHTATVLVVVPGVALLNPFLTTASVNVSGTAVIASSSSSTIASVAAPVFVPPVISCKSRVFVVYGHDPSSFDALAVGAQLGDTVILRPDITGPGAVPDATLALAVSKMRARGARVFGLVDGRYGFGQLSQVTQDIALYRDWYGLDGIGVYNVSTVSDAATFFASVAQAIRLQGLSVMFVFSGYPDSAYYKTLIDYAVFEHASPTLAATVPARAFFEYAPAQRINIVHGVSGSTAFASGVASSPYVSGVALSTGTILESSLTGTFMSSLQVALDRQCAATTLDARAFANPDVGLLHQLQAIAAALLRLLALKT